MRTNSGFGQFRNSEQAPSSVVNGAAAYGTSRHFAAMRNLVAIGAWRTPIVPHQSSSI
jgi:hypothetical protein